MKVAIVTVPLFCLLQVISGAFIPSSRKDPKLNECIADKINTLWVPSLEKAFPQYGVPVLDPHALGDSEIIQGNQYIGLNVTIFDAQLYGMQTVKFQKADFKSKSDEFSLWFKNHRFVQLMRYEAKGQILLFSINGHGRANVTATDVVGRITFKYDLVKDPKTKVKFVKVKSVDFKAKPVKAYLNFENLFDGDAKLSKQINDVINEHSMELLPTFQPSIEAVLSKAWKNVLTVFSPEYLTMIYFCPESNKHRLSKWLRR